MINWPPCSAVLQHAEPSQLARAGKSCRLRRCGHCTPQPPGPRTATWAAHPQPCWSARSRSYRALCCSTVPPWWVFGEQKALWGGRGTLPAGFLQHACASTRPQLRGVEELGPFLPSSCVLSDQDARPAADSRLPPACRPSSCRRAVMQLPLEQQQRVTAGCLAHRARGPGVPGK